MLNNTKSKRLCSFVIVFLQMRGIIGDMCGRYGFSVKNAKDVYERFDTVNELSDYKPRWNIAPGEQNPVITRHSPNQISRMVWGLIPYWAKNTKFHFTTINARVEGIASKPAFRKPFKSQRCLVPATGFFEWDKSVKPRQPYYFKLKQQDLFAFAGLYDIWRDPKTGAEIQSYTIITTEANGVVGKIHQRMPVILQSVTENARIACTWERLPVAAVNPTHACPSESSKVVARSTGTVNTGVVKSSRKMVSVPGV
jgi:putative SOS response-associated peptidase YedK